MNQRFTQIVVDSAKLRDYCLNDAHPRGRHKARVFRARLGLTDADAEWLRQTVLRAALTEPHLIRATDADVHGQRYILDLTVANASGSAVVRTDCIGGRRRATINKLLHPLRHESFMIAPAIKTLDVVALTTDVPEKRLVRGQVGTVVEMLGPGVFEVEFCDDQGRTYAQAAIPGHHLLVLHYQPEPVA